jgi:DNA-binding NtrC family response regulator
LRNVVARAAVLNCGAEVEMVDLPAASGHEIPAVRAIAGAGPEGTLDDMERRMIQDALARTRGHRQRAAEHLGISRRTLSRKLRTYALEEPVESWAS